MSAAKRNFNRTKIIATIGPATVDKKILAQMVGLPLSPPPEDVEDERPQR